MAPARREDYHPRYPACTSKQPFPHNTAQVTAMFRRYPASGGQQDCARSYSRHWRSAQSLARSGRITICATHRTASPPPPPCSASRSCSSPAACANARDSAVIPSVLDRPASLASSQRRHPERSTQCESRDLLLPPHTCHPERSRRTCFSSDCNSPGKRRLPPVSLLIIPDPDP